MLFRAILEFSFVGGLFTIVLMLFKNTIVKVSGGRKYNFICLIALLLFVVPLSLPNLLELKQLPVFHVAESYFVNSVSMIVSNSTMGNANDSRDTIYTILIVIWTVGILISGILTFVSYSSFRKKIISNSNSAADDIRKHIVNSSREANIKSNISVYINNDISSPMILGISKLVLVLPDRYMSKNDMEIITNHELIHIKRKDQLIKLFATVVRIIHWFNPLIYLLCKYVNESCEYACDESLTKEMTLNQRQYYAEMILDFMDTRTAFFQLHNALSRSKNGLKRRIELIMNTKPFPKMLAVIVVLVITLLGIGTTAYAKIFFGVSASAVGESALLENVNNDTSTVDTTSIEVGTYKNNLDSIETDQMVYEVQPSGDIIQITKGEISTNSTQIIVSIDSLSGNEKVSLFLYDSVSLTDPIQYATLTKDETEAIFTNLTYARTYNVGAIISGTNEAVLLNISN